MADPARPDRSRGPAEATIRRATADDAAGIADVWLASWRVTFHFPPSHPDEDVRRWIADRLIPEAECWVAADDEGRVIAVMALSASMLEQLYIAPAWTGRGLGRRLVALAKERRPGGLDLWCFQANTRARSFYEALGFRPVAFGDGSGNVEGQPDVRYAWRPGPDIVVSSADGTPIAVFRSGRPDGRPLVLVHGASADHTTFRVLGPILADTYDLYAMDRRGRGASGDREPYAIEREFEDVAAVAEAVATARGLPAVDVFGHSYGGRCALGAALRTPAIRRVISYEGAPAAPGDHYGDTAFARELAGLAAERRNEALLSAFLTRVVGMTPDELARYRADPVWPRRVAAAATITREVAAESSDEAALECLAGVRGPVLQLVGGDTWPQFARASRALDERLPDGRVVTIPGAKHAAHHTHPGAVADAVRSFLQAPM